MTGIMTGMPLFIYFLFAFSDLFIALPGQHGGGIWVSSLAQVVRALVLVAFS